MAVETDIWNGMVKDTLKRHWKISLVVGILIIGVGGWFVTGPKEPVYHGKTFSHWFSEIRVPPARYTNSDPTLLAIKAMGKAAVPSVTSTLHGMNSSFHNKMVYWIGNVPGFKKDYDDDTFYRAYFWLLELGPVASEAVPELIEVAQGSNPARSAKTIYLLGRIRSQPDLTVPFLMEMAKSPNKTLHSASIQALGNLGLAAKSAVPLLLSQWRAEADPGARSAMAWSVYKIDSKAAKDAGINFNGDFNTSP